MTRLTRTIQREVDGGPNGPLVVTLSAKGVVLREKGHRTETALLPWSALYERGLLLKAELSPALLKRGRTNSRRADPAILTN